MSESDGTSAGSFAMRPIGEDEFDRFLATAEQAFGESEPPEEVESERTQMEWPRTFAAFDGDVLCGTASAISLQMTVPGGQIPVTGVTWISVLPTHRRRGVLTGMMRRQLTEIDDGDEAVAALFASEPPIYGRFGYGVASYAMSLTLRRGSTSTADAPVDPSLRLRLTEPEDSLEAAERVYAATVPERPGMIARGEAWGRAMILDPESRREGASPLRCVLAEDAGGVRGFARYSTVNKWAHGPVGVVRLRDIAALDTHAYAALWRFLLDLDLTATVEVRRLPVDDALFQMVPYPRDAGPVLNDQLYIRLVDLGRALSARTYTTEVDVVVEVADAFCPWNEGRWRLSGGPKGATCDRTSDPADLAATARDLGAAYLGGTSLRSLALAGRVNELRRGAVEAAAAAFLHDPQPFCAMSF